MRSESRSPIASAMTKSLTLTRSTVVCQVVEKGSGRLVASGTVCKMQPREDPMQKVRL